jgi:hypothetical protein
VVYQPEYAGRPWGLINRLVRPARSHTCFFALDLPAYTREETLREKLLYAARYCTAIDNDTSAGGQLFADADDDGSADADAGGDAGSGSGPLPYDPLPGGAGRAAGADGGHGPLRLAGARVRAPPKPGAARAAGEVAGAVGAGAGWATGPVRYVVRFEGADPAEVEVAEDDVQAAGA